MASYLLSVTTNLEVAEPPPSPPGYFVEWSREVAADDGLATWRIDLQIAGAVAAWSKSDAYDAMWAYLEAALASLDVRPRGSLTLKSRVDPRRVAVTFSYMGAHQVMRAGADLRARIAAVVDAKTGKLAQDVEVKAHA